MKIYRYPGGRTVRADAGGLGRTLALLGALLAAAVLFLLLTGCADTRGGNGGAVPADGGTAADEAAGSSENGGVPAEQYAVQLPEGVLAAGDPASETVYRIALCGVEQDPLAEGIAERFRSRLDEIGRERQAVFALSAAYSGLDGPVDSVAGPWTAVQFTTIHGAASQAVARLPDGGADLLAGIGTAAALAVRDMADRAGKTAPEETPDTDEGTAKAGAGLPVVFAAWQGDIPAEAEDGTYFDAAEELDTAQDAQNVTGLTVYWSSKTLADLLMALQPNARKVGLLYNPQDTASAAAVSDAVALFQAHGVELVERPGSTADEIQLAAQALAADGVDAVFTPNDSAVLAAEGIVSGVLTEAGIPHYAASAAFANAGAFLGYGPDPDALGRAMADLAAAILLDGGAGDTGTVGPAAVVNGQTCAALGRDTAAVLETLAPLVPSLAVPGT